jgi:hypothetical protein
LCGDNSWIVLTKDERIRRDPAEVNAIIASGAHAIFIGRQNITAEEMLEDVTAALPRLKKRFQGAKKPAYALIHKGGRVDWLDVERSAEGIPRLSVPKPKK